MTIGTPQDNMKLFHAKMKVNICTLCEIEACLLKKIKMMEKLVSWQFYVCHCGVSAPSLHRESPDSSCITA